MWRFLAAKNSRCWAASLTLRSGFLPFRDATSGPETYGAGRYLDAEITSDGRVLLDFNRAYFPYCAYGEGWTCPLPPAENWLRAAVRAGERFPDEAS